MADNGRAAAAAAHNDDDDESVAVDAPSGDDSNESSNDLAGDDLDDVESGNDSEEALVAHHQEEEKQQASRKTKKRSAGAAAVAAVDAPPDKRARKAGASSAAPVPAAASHGPVLTPADLDTAQQFMDNCKCPRDIGRVIGRFATLANIKAVEWMNWYSVLLVPTIRELLLPRNPPSKHRLQQEHLELVILVQRVVTVVRSRVIPSSSLNKLHDEVRQLLKTADKCFPNDNGCVSPNMHLALHLRSQILDYGPPSGFWCMPYERMNGLLTRIPASRSAPAISTAKRALQLIVLSGLCSNNSAVSFGRTVDQVLPAPLGAGFTHALHVQRHNNGTQHVYSFTADDHGRQAQQNLIGWRDGTLMHAVNGNEAFPGWLLNSRRRDPIDVSLLDLPATGLEANRKAFATLSLSEKVLDDLFKIPHVKACLRSHYLEAYKAESLLPYLEKLRPPGLSKKAAAVYNRDIASLRGDTLAEKARQHALAHAGVIQWLDDPAVFSPTVRIYDKLMFAGESFDSVLSSGDSNNSYVAVAFDTPSDKPDQPSKKYLWYGRVSYFVEHTFNRSVHSYAAVRYYCNVNKDYSIAVGMKARYTDKRLPVPLCSELAQSSFTQFPVISRTFHPPHTLDLVPVHRLMHRWIPSPIRDPVKKDKPDEYRSTLQHACPVPTRIHM